MTIFAKEGHDNMENSKMIAKAALEMLEKMEIVSVGIDGLGGAGKSTIAEEVRTELEAAGVQVVLLHIDDLITPRAVRYNKNFPEWECYYVLQWRYDYFTEKLEILKKGGKTEIELYDKDNDSYITEKFSTAGRTVILTEGIFLQRKELDGSFDLTVYIDLPENIRFERVLCRDRYIGNDEEIRAKYEGRYFPAERRYVEEYSPSLRADITVSLNS